MPNFSWRTLINICRDAVEEFYKQFGCSYFSDEVVLCKVSPES